MKIAFVSRKTCVISEDKNKKNMNNKIDRNKNLESWTFNNNWCSDIYNLPLHNFVLYYFYLHSFIKKKYSRTRNISCNATHLFENILRLKIFLFDSCLFCRKDRYEKVHAKVGY